MCNCKVFSSLFVVILLQEGLSSAAALLCHLPTVGRNLGMSRVFVHRFSGILSAYGLGMADIVDDRTIPLGLAYSESDEKVREMFAVLEGKCSAALSVKGFGSDRITLNRYLNLRYRGTSTSMMTLQYVQPTFPSGSNVLASCSASPAYVECFSSSRLPSQYIG